MASSSSTVEYIGEQAGLGTRLTYRRMFGEYAVYLDGRLVALVCDDQLFLKPTPEGRAILGVTRDVPPYPGAKPHYRLDGEIEDRGILARVLEATAAALAAAADPPRSHPGRRAKVKTGSGPTTRPQDASGPGPKPRSRPR